MYTFDWFTYRVYKSVLSFCRFSQLSISYLNFSTSFSFRVFKFLCCSVINVISSSCCSCLYSFLSLLQIIFYVIPMYRQQCLCHVVIILYNSAGATNKDYWFKQFLFFSLNLLKTFDKGLAVVVRVDPTPKQLIKLVFCSNTCNCNDWHVDWSVYV